MFTRKIRRQSLLNHSGQSLIVGLAVMAVAASAIFFVFNSNRAVNDKMNLVNAADAVAYSGAQMAARELNFMALTNRAMIANEVAIGHMMSYQTEVDLIVNGLANRPSGIFGGIITALVNLVGTSTLEAMRDVSRVWSGAYILGVNEINELYSSYQEEEYRALAAIGTPSIVDAAMSAVARQYVKRTGENPDIARLPWINIAVNDPDTIQSFADSSNTALSAVAARFSAGNPFCSFIMFVTPSSTGVPSIYSRYTNDAGNPSDYRTMRLDQACQQYYRDGTEPSAEGYPTSPEADGGVFLGMLTSASNNAASQWVRDRNINYPILLGTVNMRRRGSSAPIWDTARSQINWKTNEEDTIDTSFSLILSFHGRASGDAKALSDQAATALDGAVIALLRTARLCDDIDCDSLAGGTYSGVTRYAVLNPMRSARHDQAVTAAEGPLITAVLSQDKYCNDMIGRHKDAATEGQERLDDSWIQGTPGRKLSSACERSVGQTLPVAYSQARVYYSRPSCTDPECSLGYKPLEAEESETANLFNPFWQAKLAAPADE